MRVFTVILGLVFALMGMIATAYAVERHAAAWETAEALQTIDSGLDWDNLTPISFEQQIDRMDANLQIWRSEKRQRNTGGLLGLSLIVGGLAVSIAGCAVRNREAAKPCAA